MFGGDVTPDKRTAMRTFLADAANTYGRRCAPGYDEGGRRQAPDLSSTVLVTDTAGDVRDTVEVGIRAVGVAWGMHTPEELLAAGAEFVALWPQEITAHLLGDAASASPGGACAVPVGGGAPACAVSPPAAPADTPAGDCGCGCGGDPQDRAARVRRDRRRAAADALRDGGGAVRGRTAPGPAPARPRPGPGPAPADVARVGTGGTTAAPPTVRPGVTTEAAVLAALRRMMRR